MKFNEMKYERPDLPAVKAEMQSLFSELKKAENPDSFYEIFMRINQLRVHIMTMYTLVMLHHTIDTSDSFYDKENDFWDENLPIVEEAESELYRISLACPFQEALYDRIPKTFFMLAECREKAFSSAIIPMLIEENKLVSEYGKLKASAKIPFDGEILNLAEIGAKATAADRDLRQRASAAKFRFYEDNEAAFDRIYDELVKVRTKIAETLGFENYIPLGYLRMNRLDYDAEMVEQYRNAVREHIVPIVSRLYERQRARIGYDKLHYYDLDYHFKDGNPMPKGSPEELVAKAGKMYHEMSPETGKFIDLMIENELFDLVARKNKELGGYMTEIPEYKVPFIFSNFNGTSADVDVLTHEAGHAFQYFMARDIPVTDVTAPTMESCEIHSMSMEFFAYPWMGSFFEEEEEKYKFAHLSGTLMFLPYGVLVDHFQHEIYANPQWTAEERKACWRRLEKMYMPFRDYEESPFLEKGSWWYQQGHIFQSPFYYIDYTLAQVCAQQFHIRMTGNDPECWPDYLKLCRLGGTKTFTELLKACHIRNPFEKDTIRITAEALQKELDTFMAY